MLSVWLYGTSVHHFVAVAIALAYVLSVAPSRLSLRGPLVLASTIAIRKSKTQAGQRMIPLNDDALGAIRALYRRASAIDGTRLDHYPWRRKSNLTATLESVHLDEKSAIRTYVPPVPTSNCRETGFAVTCSTRPESYRESDFPGTSRHWSTEARFSLLDGDQLSELARDLCHRIFSGTQAGSRTAYAHL